MASPTQPGERSSEFRRFWWGEAVSGLGNAITSLALQTLVVVTLSGGAVQVGWLNSARWLPYLVFGLIVGTLVDRVRRRPVMVISDVVRAGLLGLIPLAWALGVLSFSLLLVLVILFGTASLVNDAASLSFVPRLVPRSQLQRAHARLDGASAVAQTAGPAMAGVLIRFLGAPLSVLVDALSYLFSAVMVASLKGIPEPTASKPATLGVRGLAQEVKDGARWPTARQACVRSPLSRTCGSRVKRSCSCWSSRTATCSWTSQRCNWAWCSLLPESVRCSAPH
ncbi:MAG: MFS transporter [Ornithinimicrobium sp.]